jgi:tRNA (uracil-5-)-methyltransferase
MYPHKHVLRVSQILEFACFFRPQLFSGMNRMNNENETLELSYLHYDPDQYEQQLQTKIENATNLLGLSGVGTPFTICRSPRSHYRHRCRFGVGDDGTSMWYTMWENGEPTVRLLSYPLGSLFINQVMEPLLHSIEMKPNLREGLKAVHFLSTTQGDLLITLIYEKKIDEDWVGDAEVLYDHILTIGSDCTLVGIRGRSKGVKLVVGKEHVIESFILASGKKVSYLQIPDGFSNPNPEVNAQALHWICEIVGDVAKRVQTDLSDHVDFLELYCGNGNHTVALSGKWEQFSGPHLVQYLPDRLSQ